MALATYLTINGTTKEVFIAQRKTNTDTPALDPDTVSEYECWLLVDYDETPHVLVTHRYGDSGWELVRKGLEAIEHHTP